MAKAFGDMSTGIKTCANKKNADQVMRIAAIIETFKNPETLAIHIGHDILFNGVDLEQEITNGIIAFDNKNYKEFGERMGKMLSEIAIGTQTQAVMVGDDKQSDLPNGKSGLVYWYEKLTGIQDVASVKLDNEDIIRNPVISRILQRLGE